MTPPASARPLQLATLPQSPRVLLLVDFINPLDFPGAEKLAPGAVRAARCAAALKARLAKESVTTVYANDNWGVWHSDFHGLVQGCLALAGAPGEIARLLFPQAGDLTLLKPRHSAFFASPLELLLQQMKAEELVVCGLACDICIQMTAADAFLREYRLWVPADCTAAESPRAKAASLAWMRDILRCDIAPAGSVRARRKK